jgi:glutamine amidotransferase
MKAAVVDYGTSNLGSFCRALRRAGVDFVVTDQPADLEQAEWLVVPGVGSFSEAMRSLHAKRLVEPLQRLVKEEGKNYLGVCLGMQLLAERGHEGGETPGLGLLAGEVMPIPSQDGLRIPHMGWNEIQPRPGGSLAGWAMPDRNFYFMHSFHLRDEDPALISSTVDHGGPLVDSVQHERIHAFQFHPEKSQRAGQYVLQKLLC